jgi:hypothetical protein
LQGVADKVRQYTKLFPENVINLGNELNHLEHEIQSQFDKDLNLIKRLIPETNNKRKSVGQKQYCINFKKFKDDFYLYKMALYTGKQIPDTDNKRIIFFLANMYICKAVAIIILRYILQRTIPRIQRSLYDYERKTDNRLFEIFQDYIGCCRNISAILRDYITFYKHVQIKLGITSALEVHRPMRTEIREAVKQSIIKTKNAQYIALPLVRLALEFAIQEDVGIKIAQRLRENDSYKDIKELTFTRKLKPDELFKIMKQMKLCNDNQIDIIKRICEWGSRGVHQGGVVATSVIWYILFFIEEQLRDILHRNSEMEFEETRERYIQLLKDEKIKVIMQHETFFPSLYNITPIP